MRLLKLKLTDFRRFADENSLDLNEDLIALVGPNEAGKSSLLAALDLVGKLALPAVSDITRGGSGPAKVSALFVLEPDDRELLREIYQGPSVTHVWVNLETGSESATWGPEPRPRRDLRPRHGCRTTLDSLDGDPAILAGLTSIEQLPWDPQLLLDVQSHLGSTEETLPETAIASFDALAQRIRALDEPSIEEEDADGAESPVAALLAERRDAREVAATALTELAPIERQERPVTQVIRALQGRTPDVAFFGQVDRELRSTYQLAEIASAPPAALANLCSLAGLDLAAARDDITNGRVPHVEAVFEAANRRLREQFQHTWTQSDVHPRFGTPLDGVLRVMVATEGGNDYSFPEERSDGLRWFMALHAFLAARGKQDPILLVDEAETHLHYDAQADLIDALMSQRIARQVVYTTHSVGCLPPDLGRGIRVVLAKDDAERSHIGNSYWSVEPNQNQKVGYTPLLFAMGAQLLALTIPRFGVVAEGPADAILLPSILREVAGLDRLPYRVVPGLSELRKEDVPVLAQHAGSVASIADGDAGGRRICQMLRDGGMSPDRIFDLSAIAPDCTLEDLVEPSILANAINTELDAWGMGTARVESTDVPSTGRWTWLEAWGQGTGTPVERLSKVRVAQRVVDSLRARDPTTDAAGIVAPAHINALVDLHERLAHALGISSRLPEDPVH